MAWSRPANGTGDVAPCATHSQLAKIACRTARTTLVFNKQTSRPHTCGYRARSLASIASIALLTARNARNFAEKQFRLLSANMLRSRILTVLLFSTLVLVLRTLCGAKTFPLGIRPSSHLLLPHRSAPPALRSHRPKRSAGPSGPIGMVNNVWRQRWNSRRD